MQADRIANVGPLPRTRSIWLYLLALCAAIGLPAVIFVAVLLSHFGQVERERIEEIASFRAEILARSIERDFATLAGSLNSLAYARSLHEGDLRSFYGNATRASEALSLGVVVFDLEGRQLLNTRRPFGDELPMVHATVQAAIPEMVATRDLVVTDIFMGQVAGQWLYVVMVPVIINEGEILFGLQYSIPVKRLQDIVDGVHLPHDGVALVADRAGVTAARAPLVEELIGVASAILRGSTPAGEHRHYSTRPDGSAVLAFTAPVGELGWTVVSAVDLEALHAPVRQVVMVLGAIGLAVATTAAAGAAVFGSKVTRALDQLVDSADAMTRNQSSELRTSILEIDVVGKAHATVVEELQRANEVKEALLFEVNHRVKNSLAIIASLLSTQARCAAGEDAVEALQAARLRVDVIASLHRRLYETERHTNVELTPFLREISSECIAATDPDRQIGFACEGPEGLVINVAQATPVAVIVNEVVMHATSHGLAGGARHLGLEIEERHDGIMIIVTDDGGFRDDAGSKSGGARIITVLVRQLRGRLEIESASHGTRVALWFPPDQPHE